MLLFTPGSFFSASTQTKSSSWSTTKVEYRTNKPQRLPFLDVGLRDIGQANQAFKIELGHVCFS